MTGTGCTRSPARPSRPTISDSAGHSSEISLGRPPASQARSVATASSRLASVTAAASPCACEVVAVRFRAMCARAWLSLLRTVPTGTSQASAISW
ncbi:hypothetical protein [Streptomyces sp. NBC_01296]|uniref:hypothetical protein n=1 Tax=Streptomyces sp. NBC_01296 TaxID=2903816 RepID=UPI002E103732